MAEPTTPPVTRKAATLGRVPKAVPNTQDKRAAPTVTKVPVAPPAPPTRPRTARILPVGALPPVRIPPESLYSPPNGRFLAAAILISLVAHAVLLVLHFRPFDLASRTDKGPPLEIALVNAKTTTKPVKADILAQAHLDGGGNTDAERRAKSPLPVLPKSSPDQQVAVAARKVEALEQQVQELMTQLKSAPVAPATPQPIEATVEPTPPTADQLMQRTLEAMRLEAQIAKDMDAYQKRPKRRFVGARAEEYRFARYVEDWRMKIERVGNMNYPEAARQQRLYGNLVLTVKIKSDGSVEEIEVERSSGSRILDAAAIKIVEMAAPYAPFPADIKRDTDVLHITRMWTFTKADALVSN